MDRSPGLRAAPRGGVASALAGATGWLNSAPLTAPGLRGRVVLVDFWTYTCINWLRSLPYLRAWAGRYRSRGLAVVGVHTPEFSFERDLGNVQRAVEDLRVGFPVAIDNDYAIWRAFANEYWPALYLVDAQGQLRHHRFGEGDYERSERIIQQLLAGAGAGDGAGEPSDDLSEVDARGIEAAADWDSMRSPENYLGYARTENFASSGPVPDGPSGYAIPARLRLNEWALDGEWTVQREAAAQDQPGARIACRFHARDLHLVLAPATPGIPVRFRITLDGRPPGAAHGSDADGDGEGTVSQARLYQLVRQPGPVTERTFEISFLDPGVRAFAFTFG